MNSSDHSWFWCLCSHHFTESELQAAKQRTSLWKYASLFIPTFLFKNTAALALNILYTLPAGSPVTYRLSVTLTKARLLEEWNKEERDRERERRERDEQISQSEIRHKQNKAWIASKCVCEFVSVCVRLGACCSYCDRYPAENLLHSTPYWSTTYLFCTENSVSVNLHTHTLSHKSNFPSHTSTCLLFSHIHTRGLFQKAGLTNSESNPELWADEPRDGKLSVFGSRTADLSQNKQSWLNWVKSVRDDYKSQHQWSSNTTIHNGEEKKGCATSPNWS